MSVEMYYLASAALSETRGFDSLDALISLPSQRRTASAFSSEPDAHRGRDGLSRTFHDADFRTAKSTIRSLKPTPRCAIASTCPPEPDPAGQILRARVCIRAPMRPFSRLLSPLLTLPASGSESEAAGLGHKRPGVLAAAARQCPTAADHAQGDTNFASPRTEAGIDAIRRLATARSSNSTREVLVQPEDEVRRRLSRVR